MLRQRCWPLLIGFPSARVTKTGHRATPTAQERRREEQALSRMAQTLLQRSPRATRSIAHQREASRDANDGEEEDHQVENVEELADCCQAMKSMRCFGQQEGDAASGEGTIEPCPGEAAESQPCRWERLSAGVLAASSDRGR